MTDDTVGQQWQELREVLVQNIGDRLQAQPEDQRTLWDLSNDTSADAFPEVMTFLDEMFGAKPLDWLQVQIRLETEP